MMMATIARVLLSQQQILSTLVECVLERPAKTLAAVLVDSFDHEEDGAHFEDGGAYDGGDAAAPGRFTREGGCWVE